MSTYERQNVYIENRYDKNKFERYVKVRLKEKRNVDWSEIQSATDDWNRL